MAVREKPPKAAVGRPSIRSAELAREICRRIAEGATLKALGEMDDMPCWESIRTWLNDDAEFLALYARAREAAGDAYEARILTEMDLARDKDSAAAARVRIDALKWLAAKRAPKVYGDRLDLNHSGALDIKVIPEDKLNARLADLLGKAGASGASGGAGAQEGEAAD